MLMADAWRSLDPTPDTGCVVPVGIAEFRFEVGFFVPDHAEANRDPDQGREYERPDRAQQQRHASQDEPVAQIDRIAAETERTARAQGRCPAIWVDRGAVPRKGPKRPYEQCQPESDSKPALWVCGGVLVLWLCLLV